MKFNVLLGLTLLLFVMAFTFLSVLAKPQEMVLLEGGKFKMGSEKGEINEKPVHNVQVSQFYIGKYEVTNSDYCEFLNDSRSMEDYYPQMIKLEKEECGIIFDKGKNLYTVKKGQDKYPVVWVSWYGATEYCNWMSKKEGLDECYLKKSTDLTKNGYRLPMEAEWEYACRGESETKYFWGDDMEKKGSDYCWYIGNSLCKYHNVGEKLPNKFGLYDMSGGVSEWCNDWYSSSDENPYKSDKEGYYSHKDAQLPNPPGPDKGQKKVIRGGSFGNYDYLCASSFRSSMEPSASHYLTGFRVAKNGGGAAITVPVVPVKGPAVIFPQTVMTGNASKEYMKSLSSQAVLIDGGKFKMGNENGEKNEKPLHPTEVSSFYMGKYEITNGEYCDFLNYMKDKEEGIKLINWEKEESFIKFDKEKKLYTVKKGYENYPVSWITWYGAAAYCNWLSESEGLEKCYDKDNLNIFYANKNGYRLPTEAEWEYACRAGTETAYFWGNTMKDDNGAVYCWYSGNSENMSHEIGKKQPNKFGLYDMSGSVWEWCGDWYSALDENPYKSDKDGYYSHKDAQGPNPTGPDKGEKKVVRGGCWSMKDDFCRSSFRNSKGPGDCCQFLGFRIVKNGSAVALTVPVVPAATVPAVTGIASEPATTGTVTKEYIASLSDKSVLLDGGNFEMGDKEGRENEQPLHTVEIKPFYIARYEVTNTEYCEFLNHIKNKETGITLIKWEKDQCGITFDTEKNLYIVKKGQEQYPVVWVTWYGAVAYCNWLSEITGLEKCYDKDDLNVFYADKNGYRLPTEAEWEYACRAEKKTEYFWGDDMKDDDGGDYCWYSGNSGDMFHDVGEKRPNKFGLYDMSGGVWEWCNDWYSGPDENQYKSDKDGYYSHKDAQGPNPTGPDKGEKKVVRGGSFGTNDYFCRSAFRNALEPSNCCYLMGFRVVGCCSK